MPGGSGKSRFMQRCVADVTGQGKELGRAFAICTAQSQKSGYSDPGSVKQTGKGKAREKFFKKQPDMGKKAGAYEKAVQAGRKAEDMAAVFAQLQEGRPAVRPKGGPAPKQRGSIILYPEDMKPDGWQMVLDALDIASGEAADWQNVEHVEIHFDAAKFAYEKE
jgi:hypothetical protein